MIRRLGVKNFFSIKDGIEVNFEFDGRVPKSISNGRDVAAVIGIKGANGSGKTNIIKALSFLRQFCVSSSKSDNESKIMVDSFFNNQDPVEFYVEFTNDDKNYYYELDVTENCVVKESLQLIKPKKSVIFERVSDDIVNTHSDLDELKKIRVKSNASLISEYRTFKFDSEMKDMDSAHIFFVKMITNVNYSGYYDFDFDYREISKKYYESPEVFEFVKKIIISSDSGVDDVKIHQGTDEKGKDYYFPLFTHSHSSDSHILTFLDQSSGTQALYNKLSLYHLVLSTGGLLALDEFDIHMHAMILPYLMDLFNSDVINTTNAQFIFTSHNTEIIDKLGKYRTILVNKEDNETYGYRLDEIKGSILRNDRKISPTYMDGKIGGVPSVPEVSEIEQEDK